MSPRSSYMCFVLAAVLKLDRTSFCWRQINDNDLNHMVDSKTGPRVHTYCFMDEMFLAVSKSREIAQAFKSYIVNYLQNSLHLNVDNRTEILPCEGHFGVCFVGTLARRQVKESPAIKAIHK
ncbi:hypothetical protein WN944_023166 [Citrus x changshan-huyou]|uniref:Uncharacterized protein n=1 Tax=Citrus x changshan-huyou TaxID=2935761 RepID=A0AAP0N5A2_9ROSI